MKITVITINRNNAAGLEKTLQSVIAQDYGNLEYLVIDGASTDNSVDLIRHHAQHITHWQSEPDTGIYNAMNKGIEKATGDWLLFMNAGDTFARNDILTVFAAGNYPDDIVFGNQIRHYPDGKTDIWQVDNQPIDFVFFARRGIPHQSTFIRRAIFEKHGHYREDLPIYADWELVARAVLVHGNSIRHIPLAVCIYDMDGMSTNADTNKRGEEKKRARLGLFSQMVWDSAEECYELRKKLDRLHARNGVRLLLKVSDTLKALKGK